MSTTFPARAYISSAPLLLDSTGITSSATTFKCQGSISLIDVLTGTTVVNTKWFAVTVDYGTTNAEKIYCTFDSSTNTFTIKQRNVDGSSSATSHAANAVVIFTWTGTEAAEAQAAVQALHGVLTNSGTATVPVGVVPGATASAGTAQIAAPIDHVHSLANSDLNTWLQNNATGTIASGVSVPVAQLSGTLTAAQLSNAANTWYPTPVTSGTLTNSSASYISQTGVTGFTTYLITFNASVAMGSTTKGVVASIGINGTATSTVMTQTIQASSSSILTSTFIYTTTASATPTINGMLFVGSGGSATLNAATLSIVGLA